MLNHTTSHPPKRPHPRRNQKMTGYQLPRGRARSARRPGATYLNHSQGFGNAGHKRRGGNSARGPRRSQNNRRNSTRRTYAFMIVGCALLFFVASVIWYLNRSVTVTLNGSDTSIHINATLTQLIENEGLDESCDAGDLLAVDDSVLERGGGDRYAVTLDGEDVAMDELDSVHLAGGETVEVADGADVYEEHDVEATEIAPTITVEGTGAIGFVRTWGIPGRSEVWTGKQSGIVQDRGVVQEVQNCEVVYRSVSPDGDGKYVALTFDEGPSSHTQEILDVLEEKGVHATFFLQGETVAQNPSAARAIAEAGHELGSNAYTDTRLSSLSGEDLRSQLTNGFAAIKDATGTTTSLLRAPYAAFSTENWAESMDLVSAVVSWNIDSGDWLLPGADTVVSNVTGSVRNGNIVLLTDSEATGAQTAEALGTLIDRLQADGFTIVTLSELVATDEDLAEELDISKVSMPEDAVLPTVPADDEGSSA